MRARILLPLLLFAPPAFPQDTEAALRERARLNPQSFEASHRLGEFYIQRGELRNAVRYLGDAYRIDPENYDNAYDLALACLETSALDEARKVIASLLRRQDRSELHNLLGDVEEAAGHTLDAVKQYEAAARMDPSEKNVFDLGSDLLNHKGFQQALEIFEFGAGRYPRSAKMRVGAGIAEYSLGRYNQAVEALCAAVDLDPADTRALDFLGKMRDISPELAGEVTRRLARFVQLDPNNAAANYYYALSLRGRALTGGAGGHESKIEALLLRAIRLNPKLADAYYQLGLLYEDQKLDAKAIPEYEAAIRLRPDLKPAHYRLARLYAAAGQSQRAEKEFQIFRSLKDNPPSIPGTK